MAVLDKRQGRRVQSVEVGAQLLMALAEARRAVSLSELSAMADMAPAKAHRYLASYIRSGLVDHRHNGFYDLGPAAARMGLCACARVDLIGRSSDKLIDLVRAHDAVAMLSVWSAHGPTVIRIERDGSLSSGALGLGVTMTLLDTSSGRVFLSWHPRRATQEFLDHERALRGGKPDDAEIADMVAETRALGYAYSARPAGLRIYSLAGPVLNGNGGLEAVITLVSLSETLLRDQRAIEAMRTGAGAHRWPHQEPAIRRAELVS